MINQILYPYRGSASDSHAELCRKIQFELDLRIKRLKDPTKKDALIRAVMTRYQPALDAASDRGKRILYAILIGVAVYGVFCFVCSNWNTLGIWIIIIGIVIAVIAIPICLRLAVFHYKVDTYKNAFVEGMKEARR